MGALYYGTAQLGLLMALPPGLATPVWPPSGFALAAVVCRGTHLWPGIWLGSFLANSHLLAASGVPPVPLLLIAGAIGLGSTCQALLGASLLRYWVETRPLFARVHDVLRFVSSVGLSCLIAATVGTLSVCVSGLAPWRTYGAHWVTWYLGDLMGMLTVVPLFLTWQPRLPVRPRLRRLLEGTLVFGLLGLTAQAAFGHVGGLQVDPYMLLPLLGWIVFRCGQRGTVVAILLVSAIAIWGTLHGFGPFVKATRHESLLALQAFLGIVTITGLVLAAALTERVRAAAALRESEARFRQLVEHMAEVFWLMDLWKPAVRYISPAYEALWGRSCQSLYAHPDSWLEAIHPEDQPRVLAAREEQRGGVRTSLEYRIFQPNGALRWVRERSVPIVDATDAFTQVAGIAEDITARKGGEQTRAQLAAIVESSEDAILGTTLEGRITSWNRGAERLYGYTAAEMIGQPLALLCPPEIPDESPQLLARLQHGEHIVHYETQRRRKDGTRLDVSLSLSPTRDETGRLIGAAKIARDVTARKQLEATVRAATDSLHLVTDAMAAPVARCSRDLRYLWVSRAYAAWLGRAPDTIVGRPLCDILGPDAFAALRPYFERALAGEVVQYESQATFPGKGRLWISASYTPTVDARGRPDGWVAVVSDITDRKQIEVELERRIEERTAALHQEMAERQRLERAAQRTQHFARLGRLAAGVSHEIRNPLGAITLHVDILEEELRAPGPDSAAEIGAALAEIKTQLARVDDLLQDYLSLVRVSTITRESADLGTVVATVVQEMNAECTARGITLVLDGLDQLGTVALHRNTLQRALLNLLHNALDAMPRGGTLTLRGRRQAAQAQLDLSDTGTGIPAAHLARVFEPLYTTKPGGTGFGLYIVQEVVAAHGGQVTVESVEGHGTTFTITLPQAVG
jgi:PAS domain S-box-containing protein